MLQVSALFIYPIKSLGGISLSQAIVEQRGFRYDRRFMLVTPNGHCLTQHRNAQMALLNVAIEDGRRLRVWHRHQPTQELELPLTIDVPPGAPTMPVHIWDSKPVAAVVVSTQADRWFSRMLGEPCCLVYMPQATRRTVDPAYARYQEIVSFADGYPYLLVGQRSLEDLNQRAEQPLEMIRFRPNIVISGGQPYEEETWERFRIGQQLFYSGESCGRCLLTTLDPATGKKGAEPLRTLATYRQQGNKLVFGQYVLAETPAAGINLSSTGESIIRIRQPLQVLSSLSVVNQSVHG